jgi:glycosyltransferase involved in cell wall biosynthesis
MRYLQIISSLNPACGGPADGVRQLCKVAARMGHEVEIATLDPPGAGWGADLDCQVHELGPARLRSYSYSARLQPWLRMNASRFQAVVVNGLWQYPGYAVWQALRQSATPYYVFPHGMLDPWFKRRYPLKHMKKWVYWPWAEYCVLRDARGVLFTCEEERLQARQSFFLYRAREMVVSYGTPGPPAGSDPLVQREAFLRNFPQLRDRRYLLFLGRVHAKKGCDLLVNAFAQVAARHPQLRLVIAGPDPDGMRAGLLSGCAGLDPERIVWTGMISGDIKWGAFRAADAFVLPSHQENFGIAVVEALACGTPVLISNKVNIWREIAEHDGGLVEEDTAAGTERLLTRWLALDPAQRAAMANAAPQIFQQYFHIDSAARKLHDALENGIHDRPQPRHHLLAT